MKFSTPLLAGRLIRRYKRFLADIELSDGTQITAHCPNPGRMMGVVETGLQVLATYEPHPKRRLQYTWQFVKKDEEWIGVNTQLPNQLVAEALANKELPLFLEYTSVRREVPYGNRSRIDFLLEKDNALPCYLEIKNVHMVRQTGIAEFPDSVTERGAKHMYELANLAAQGYPCYVLYVIQRFNVDAFQWAEDIDPGYAKAAQVAQNAGVIFQAYPCLISPPLIHLSPTDCF